MRIAMARERESELAEAISAELGRPIELRFREVARTVQTTEGEAPATEARAPDAAEQHPLVQEAVKTFKARITHVERKPTNGSNK